MSVKLYQYNYQDIKQLVESFLLKVGKKSAEKDKLISDGYLKCLSGALSINIVADMLYRDDIVERSLFSEVDTNGAIESMEELLTDLFEDHDLEMQKDGQSLIKELCGEFCLALF